MKSIKNINLLMVVGLFLKVSVSLAADHWEPSGPTEEDILAATKVENLAAKGSREDKLISAVKNGDLKNVETCIAAGVGLEARDNENKTALMRAAEKGRADIVRILIDAGADVNAKDSFRCTAFFHAADKKHVDIVKILMAAGDATDRDTFEGVFMGAVHSGNTEMVKALMVGSDRIRCDTFDTAYMIAGRKPEIRNIIKEHLANLNSSESGNQN
jgi:ankyrin repeat protein